VVAWETVATFSYVVVIASAIVGAGAYFVLSRYQQGSPDRGVRPELDGFECTDPESHRWMFLVRNAGEGSVERVTATVIEKNRRGYGVNRTTVEIDDTWGPGETIEVKHAIEREESSAIELRVDCAGPNDLRVRFRQSAMGDLEVESRERTVFA